MVHDNFEQFIISIANRPYRKLVADRMMNRSESELGEAVREAEGRLPERLSALVPGYLDAARDKFLRSKLFWQASTCREALANILACMELGVSVVDAAVAGLGGCPYAKGAAGNVASEDLVFMLQGMDIDTGVDLDRLIATGRFISDRLSRENRSRVGLAGVP